MVIETDDQPAVESNSSSEPAAAFSEGEMIERNALGLPLDSLAPRGLLKPMPRQPRRGVKKRAIRVSDVLNEAPDYPRPSSFSRGLRADLEGGVTHLFLSGTASVGRNGETLYPGDFKAQLWRAYRNLTRLLESEGATWHDVVRCTCYISDIDRDYADFNAIRTEFFSALALDPLPASTAVQARLCRCDLLVEIDAHAILDATGPPA